MSCLKLSRMDTLTFGLFCEYRTLKKEVPNNADKK